jgi:hypothetical protein
MISKTGSFALATLIALVSGCATSPPPSKNPSAQLQVNFNFTPPDQPGSPKKLVRAYVRVSYDDSVA